MLTFGPARGSSGDAFGTRSVVKAKAGQGNRLVQWRSSAGVRLVHEKKRVVAEWWWVVRKRRTTSARAVRCVLSFSRDRCCCPSESLLAP